MTREMKWMACIGIVAFTLPALGNVTGPVTRPKSRPANFYTSGASSCVVTGLDEFGRPIKTCPVARLKEPVTPAHSDYVVGSIVYSEVGEPNSVRYNGQLGSTPSELPPSLIEELRRGAMANQNQNNGSGNQRSGRDGNSNGGYASPTTPYNGSTGNPGNPGNPSSPSGPGGNNTTRVLPFPPTSFPPGQLPSGPNATGETERLLNTIITVGEKVMQLIKSGAPVLTTATQNVHVVPAAQMNWMELENWRGPVSKTIELKMMSKSGLFPLITQAYTVVANYGGQLNGRGQFLSNVSIIPRVNLEWFWTLDSWVEVGEPVNVGTSESPIAGVPMTIRWKATSTFQAKEGSEMFFVTGDGRIQRINLGR